MSALVVALLAAGFVAGALLGPLAFVAAMELPLWFERRRWRKQRERRELEGGGP